MPNRNGTGPEGKGQKTGRGLGNCGDKASSGVGRGRGLGTGLGLGRNVARDKEKKDEKN